jgi:hypothetical protein
LYSDAVDWGPSVKRFSDTVDQNECMQLVQGHIVLYAIDRRNVLMEWLVNVTILLEAPNSLHDHNIICTYNDIVNQYHGGIKSDLI